MADSRTVRVYVALRKTNPKAAKDYLDFAEVREAINRQLVHNGSAPKVYEEVVEG